MNIAATTINFVFGFVSAWMICSPGTESLFGEYVWAAWGLPISMYFVGLATT
jgi:hypothetical protein